MLSWLLQLELLFPQQINNYGDGELVASFTVDLDSTNGGFDTISFGGSAEPSIATGGAFSANSSFVQNGESITPDYFLIRLIYQVTTIMASILKEWMDMRLCLVQVDIAPENH